MSVMIAKTVSLAEKTSLHCLLQQYIVQVWTFSLTWTKGTQGIEMRWFDHEVVNPIFVKFTTCKYIKFIVGI